MPPDDRLDMRIAAAKIAIVFAALVAAMPCVQADHAPSYVVPGRPDVPVIINFFDASWGVVEGEWGLYRPGAVSPTVIPAPYVTPRTQARPYYPSLGGIPSKGRLEIEPPANRQLPPPAPSYHRSWSTESQNLPATEYAPVPSVIMGSDFDVDSNGDRRRDRNGKRHHHRRNHRH
jgi:hypothetical protein